MIPREILKKIRQIEIRTSRLVCASVAGSSVDPTLQFGGIPSPMPDGGDYHFPCVRLDREIDRVGPMQDLHLPGQPAGATEPFRLITNFAEDRAHVGGKPLTKPSFARVVKGDGFSEFPFRLIPDDDSPGSWPGAESHLQVGDCVLKWAATFWMRQSAFCAPVQLSHFLGGELVIHVTELQPDQFCDFGLLFRRQPPDLFHDFYCAHGGNLPGWLGCARWVLCPFVIRHSSSVIPSGMIPREILKKIRQIELRTNRIVTETLAGQYHSVFKGQGMNFDEVREYQPGDDVRAIDWNVTARMNHPFIKKFVEERELTLMLVVDVSGSGRFGSCDQSKRELAAEIASVLAFSAIRNNDKVGLILFSDEVEKFIPPRKGRSHVLRVIREVLFFEPKRRGTDLAKALEFLSRVTPHKSIAVVLSDFIEDPATQTARKALHRPRGWREEVSPLTPGAYTAMRQTNRRHDVVAVHITDPHELALPALGRLVLEDAETGQQIEVNTALGGTRAAFADRQARAQAELVRLFRAARIDAIQLSTDPAKPYAIELAKFFETREKRRLRG
jgi:uncharacterized protein (DUF58 family)